MTPCLPSSLLFHPHQTFLVCRQYVGGVVTAKRGVVGIVRPRLLDMLRKAVMKRLLLRRKRRTTPTPELPIAEVGGVAGSRESMADLYFVPHKLLLLFMTHENQDVRCESRMFHIFCSPLTQNHFWNKWSRSIW